MEVPTIVKVLSLLMAYGCAYLLGYMHAKDNHEQ